MNSIQTEGRLMAQDRMEHAVKGSGNGQRLYDIDINLRQASERFWGFVVGLRLLVCKVLGIAGVGFCSHPIIPFIPKTLNTLGLHLQTFKP